MIDDSFLTRKLDSPCAATSPAHLKLENIVPYDFQIKFQCVYKLYVNEELAKILNKVLSLYSHTHMRTHVRTGSPTCAHANTRALTHAHKRIRVRHVAVSYVIIWRSFSAHTTSVALSTQKIKKYILMNFNSN